MATPQSTPHPPLHPNSASKKNAVHTPAGPASAPRSIPSPAAIRVTSGKTPAGGSMKMGGTPMGLSLSSLGMSPSGFTPGAGGGGGGGGGQMMMGGLSIAGFTPNSSSSTVGGMMMMMPSMSDLGLSASSSSTSKRGGGDGEYERKKKMKTVLRRIGGRSAGVGEEGICRVSRRVGLANDVDAEGEEARREREGERGISIAGRDVLIDVDMKGNRARGVVVAGMGGVEQGEMERAGRVLEMLLVDGEGDLEGFGRELGRIAGLDRVGERGVSAFQAVSGVGGCLQRLWRKECEGDDERKVLKKRSGRPWMHSRGRIGLGVDYWTTSLPKDGNAMDLDHHHQHEEAKENPSDFLTLHITAETCPAGMYPPIRISTNWLPEDLSSSTSEDENNTTASATTAATEFQIPWQDPPPTYTTPFEDESSSTDPQQQQSKLPDIRFLAKLDPPLIVPYSTASQIFAEMGGEGVQGMVMFREWHLMLASEEASKHGHGKAVDAVATQDAVLRASGLHGTATVIGKEGEEVKHFYDLDVTKAEWGFCLSEVPFVHPRQLVGLLPVLRQWGVFGGIVASLLSSSDTVVVEVEGDVTAVGQKEVMKKKEEENKSEEDLLSLLLLQSSPLEGEREEDDGKAKERNARVRVEISTTPQPTLSFGIPLPTITTSSGKRGRRGGGIGRVVVSVRRNAEIVVEFVEGFGGGEDGSGHDDDGEGVVVVEEVEADNNLIKERIQRGLEVCEGEVGVWIEWLRGGGWRKVE